MSTSSNELYQEYPADIRRIYVDAVQVRPPHKRHSLMLELAERGLEYLGSLALSDYRSNFTDPSEQVEALLERLRLGNLTMGSSFSLFQESARAAPNSLFPEKGAFNQKQLADAGRLEAAMAAINDVLSVTASDRPADINVDVCVGRALALTPKKLPWWRALKVLVEYRNCIAHSGRHRWPIHSESYYETFAPLVEAAIIEALTFGPAKEAILDHPVAGLTNLTESDDGTFLHTFCGEDRGKWFDHDLRLETPVMDRWPSDDWHATMASKYVLERQTDADSPSSVRALYWDIHDSPPPPLAIGPHARKRRHIPLPRTEQRVMRGRGVGPGTCGEFAQGPLPDGQQFHVTCPINQSSTVDVQLMSSGEFTIEGTKPYEQQKLELALRCACDHFEIQNVLIKVRQWSDLDIGKGMGSSTADVLAGIRAVANAMSERLSPETEGRLATMVESSDGTMYPGINVVSQKTGQRLRDWSWYPEFVIVMLVPYQSVLTEAIAFEGKETLAPAYERLLGRFDMAVQERSISDFAAASTDAIPLNARYLTNLYAQALLPRLDDLGALGLNIGHTGSVCGVLYPNDDEGQARAADAYSELSRSLAGLREARLVTTPPWAETSS